MTLCDKIRLMKDLIKENPDITIGEYERTVKEIESVEQKTEAMYLQTTGGILKTEIVHELKKQAI
jgi:hypothetical protein